MTEQTTSTYRAAVTLPPMPDESDLSQQCPPLTLPRAEIESERLMFDDPNGFDTAIARGFFLLRMPTGINLSPADQFAAHFHEDPADDCLDRFRGFRNVDVPGDYQGYFSREHDQWENFYIERSNWSMLPAGIGDVGKAMSRIGRIVLTSALAHLGIPESWWSELTGGLSNDGGHQMLAFNHFRPKRLTRGSKFHRDSGWVTVLRSTEPGLVALVDDTLYAILPEPGYFIINFGSSIEVLTENMSRPVRANIHGVAGTNRGSDQLHRTSYVTFLDSDLNGTIYRGDGQSFHPVQSVTDFAAQEVSRTYDASSHL